LGRPIQKSYTITPDIKWHHTHAEKKKRKRTSCVKKENKEKTKKKQRKNKEKTKKKQRKNKEKTKENKIYQPELPRSERGSLLKNDETYTKTARLTENTRETRSRPSKLS